MLRGTLVGLVLVTIAAIALPWPAGAETQIALVIGNSAYPSGPLSSPQNDAKAIEAKLKVLGFRVIMKTDLGREEFFNAIRDFGDRLKQPDTVGLFYYSGHGMQVNNRNYMIPTDADIRSDFDVGRYAVPVEDILVRMELGKSKPNIVILDACRNNPFEKRFKSSQDGLARMDAPEGTLIAFAAATGRVAESGLGGKLSLYTEALVEQLDQPYPNFIDMFRAVQNAVSERSERKQSPRLELAPGLPDFSFKRIADGPVPKKTKPAEPPATGTGDEQKLGTFKDWSAFSNVAGKNKICYIGTESRKQKEETGDREPAYLHVAHRPSENVIGEVSVHPGYTYKEGSDAEAFIDGKSFKLFTRGGNAWLLNAAANRTVVRAMKAGKQLLLKGTPDEGPSTVDTYSLAGFSQALEVINEACGVSQPKPQKPTRSAQRERPWLDFNFLHFIK